MATQSKRRNSGHAPEERDDRSVDVLLRVASGPGFLPRDFKREEALQLQAEFEPLVQMAIDAPGELQRQEFSRRLGELQRGGLSIWLGSARLQSGKQTLVRYSSFRDMHARLSYALLLLAEEQAPYQRVLRRCELPSCNKFYLAQRNPKGGPANRVYCSPEHRDERHNSYDRKRPK
jgi:hypothetical protein